MDLFPFIQHPENAQFGRGTNEGAFELLNPFKVQQPINTKMRRDPRLALYNVSRNARYDTVRRHFRESSSDPRIHDVFANEIVWRHRDPHPMTYPEGDIRETGFSALNGLSPLMNIKPVGVAAGTSAGDGLTDFAVTESGLVSMINNSNWDILTGDYVAAIFPTDDYFTSGQNTDTDRSAAGALMPKRAAIRAINPVGLAPKKLMAAIVPINRLLNGDNPELSPFAASMNGMFVVPTLGTPTAPSYEKRCILPSYLRRKFESDPVRLMQAIRGTGAANDIDELRQHCFHGNSDIMRMDIWQNFGIGKALSTARKGRSFQCLLGVPFELPKHEWDLRTEAP